MNFTPLLGFFSSILIGVSLGLIGGGGSILTLPVLVYLFGINPLLSSTYSLFVVGATSLIGSIGYMKKNLVNYQVAALFIIPSLVTIYFTRSYIITAFPDPILIIGNIAISKSIAIMSFFGIIMLLAAYSMIKKNTFEFAKNTKTPNHLLIVLGGIIIGIITGIVGIGGGFLIIPTLVLVARLSMKMAVGTSLLIIGIKSLIGFAGDLTNFNINWSFLLGFTTFSIVGIFVGTYLSRFIEGEKLKKMFGWFVLVMGVFIVVKELIIR